MPEKLRVLRAITRLNIGGPAIHTILLTRGLQNDRFSSVLVTGQEGPHEGSMRDLAAKHGVTPHYLNELGREVSPLNDLRATLAMYRLIRRNRPHIVHTHMAKAGTAGRIAAKLARVPIIVHTFHGHTFHSYWGPVKSAVFLQIERTLGAMTDRIIAVGDAQKADIASYGVAPLSKILTIPLGLEIEQMLDAEQHTGALRAELGVDADRKLIGIVARLVPIKAHEVFLEAAVAIRAAQPNTTFLIIGDGERRVELESMAQQLGVADVTRFLGWRADMRDVYADLDVVTLCSNNEGSPVALIEALAAGRPVVSTRVGGVPNVVHDGESGLLVPPRDPAAFAEAVLALLRDPSHAAQLGLAGRAEVFPKHSSGRLVQDVERLYLELAREKGLARVSTQPFALIHLLAGLLALGLATVATPLVGRLAGRIGLVAYPKRDRWHTTPTPLMGGVAIFVGSVPLVVLIAEAFSPHMLDRFAALLIGAVLIFALGLIDDLKTLPPYAKLLGQIVAACVLVASMPIGRYLPWSVLMVPVMIFWIVGVTNAFNLLDNMDGLSAGIAAIVSMTLFAFNFVQGDHQTALLCIVIAGACGGFLIFNFNPARIFMGDCGSLLIGYLLSGIVLQGAAKAGSELALTLLVPVGVMALPILDTTLVTIVRSLHHRPISMGGRDHLSHRVALGLNERSAVLVLYAVSLLFGSLAVASNYVSGPVTVLLGSLLVLGIGFFGIYLGQVRIYTEADYQRIQSQPGIVGKLVLGGSWLYKRQLAEMLLDLTLICLGLLAAYLIRFEGNLERHYVEQYAVLLPWIVSIKLVTLFAMGVYRSVWRYMGTSDMLRLVISSTVGSALAFGAIQLAFRGEGGAPRAVLMVDWIVVTALIIAARMSFVLIRDILARLRKRDLVRVLIIGAGDTGELVLRAMARNRTKAYRVIGFLDDDAEMRDRSIHGVRVLGPSSTLGEVVDRQPVEEVVLTTNYYSDDLLAECRRRGITFRDVGAFFFRSQIDGEAEPQPRGVGVR